MSYDGGGGDDDDFQNPSEAIAITQNLILSSLRNPSRPRPPLRPSNGAPPPRKKQKASVSSTGKENRRAPRVRSSSRSRASTGFDEGRGGNGSKLGEEVRDGELGLRVSRVPEVCNGRKVVGVEGFEESKSVEDLKNGEIGLIDSRGSDDCKETKVERDGKTNSSPLGIPNESNLMENLGNEHDLLSDSGDLDDCEKSEAVRDEIQSTFVSDSCISSSCNQMKPAVNISLEGNGFQEDDLTATEDCRNGELDMKDIDVSVVVSSLEIDSSVRNGCGNFELEPAEGLQMEEFGFKNLNGCQDTKCLKAERASFYSMSIESRLLGSRVKSNSSNGGDCCVDFELGTQLNVLMDLCSEIGEGSSSNGDFFCKGNDLVECPLCGADITHLSEELRQVHSNDCLDKDGTPEVTTARGAIKSDSPRQVAGLNPVLDWLRTLGLSKYEEAFIREEVDWETLKWLTEEDLLSIGIVALGPRKKIVHALSELQQTNDSGQGTEIDIPNITTVENSKASVSGNKLITQYFQGPTIHGNKSCSLGKSRHVIEKPSKDSVHKKVGPKSNIKRGKFRDIPPWCCIPGTPFRVDAFRFLRGDCSHWFLTHFHMDHYQGLTRNFCHGKIYCSSITAHLVNMKIGVPWERLQILPLNQKVNVAGVNLTCLDANHCPGSIIILFEPPNGKAVLHTGDFRFSAEMASSSILQSCHVHTLILDTTYCNPQYDFPKQEAVIQFVIEAIQAEAFNPKTLFLIGTYTIGKERLFLEVAQLLKKKVFVGAAKLRLLRCLGLHEDDMQWFTANEMESHIHVVPMWTIASFKRMKHISHQYSNRFNLIVAFSPTGWTFGKGKKKTPGRKWQQGTIIRYEVPYSEHCSFTELKEFVQFISAEHIIPSVNNEGPESADSMLALLKSDPQN